MTTTEAARPPKVDDDPAVLAAQAECRAASEQLAAAERAWADVVAAMNDNGDALRRLDGRAKEPQARLDVARATLVVEQARRTVAVAREAAQRPLDQWHVRRCKALAPRLLRDVLALRDGIYRTTWAAVQDAIDDGSGSALHKPALLLGGLFDLDRNNDSTPTEAAAAQLRRWLDGD